MWFATRLLIHGSPESVALLRAGGRLPDIVPAVPSMIPVYPRLATCPFPKASGIWNSRAGGIGGGSMTLSVTTGVAVTPVGKARFVGSGKPAGRLKLAVLARSGAPPACTRYRAWC